MTSPFGVPPPPDPHVFEPGTTRVVPGPEDHVKHYAPERHPWRRRAVVTLAALAVVSLLAANAATWVHFRLLSPSRAASAVAPATLSDAQNQVVALLDQRTSPQVIRAATRSLAQGNAEAAQATLAGDDTTVGHIDTAARQVVASAQFAELWRAVVLKAAVDQRALARHGDPDTAENEPILQLDLTPLAEPLAAALRGTGLTFVTAADLPQGDYRILATASAADHRFALTVADELWWLFVLLTLGFGAAAFYLAGRRLRLAVLVAVDIVLVLAVSLVLVAAGARVAGGQAYNPLQEVVFQHAYRAITHSLVTQTLALMVVAACSALVLAIIARRRTVTARRGQERPPTYVTSVPRAPAPTPGGAA